MARKQVVEVQCDRCERVEYQEMKGKKSVEASLEIVMIESRGETGYNFKFSDLCSPCESTVWKLVEQIAKKVTGKSPSRTEAKKKASPETDPSSTLVSDVA